MNNRNTPSKFGRYMVGCFDVLGQSNKLLEMPRNPRSREEVAPYLKQTAGVVLGIRNSFEMFFATESEFAASLSPHERKHFFNHTRTRQLRWGFSDTYIVAAPVMHEGDKVLAVVSEIYRTMVAASFMWLASMSAGHPLRGGIEIGLAVDIGPAGQPREVYGPALVEAYHLESRIAEYPRIMVGKGCIEFLRVVASDSRQLTGDSEHRAAAKHAKTCLRMLCNVQGEHAMLDSLGDDFLEAAKRTTGLRGDISQRAYDQVVAQLRQAKANKECKLTRRYETLLQYFRDNAAKWRINTSTYDGLVSRSDRLLCRLRALWSRVIRCLAS